MKTTISAVFSIYFLVSLNLSYTQVAQPDEWCSSFPDLPGGGAIWGHASCILGDTLYVAGGSSAGSPSTTFYKYSISGNTWTIASGTPIAKSGGDLVTCGNKIYYVGGGSTAISIATPECFVYTPQTGSWLQIADLPSAVSGNVAECYQDSLIYCMMGGWLTFETIIQVYSVNSNTWSQATPIPSGNGRRSFAGGLTGNKLFVCAGFGSSGFRNDFWIGTINPANHLQITWQQKTNLAIPTSRPGGVAMMGKFYVIMGEISGGSANDSIAIWDTTTSLWSYRDGKPIRTNNLSGSVSANITYCNNRPGVKIWCAGGSIQGQTTRPLDVYADTCLLNCTNPLTGVSTGSIISEYVLYQNYPNPFNPITLITYDLPKGGRVKISICDILGREVYLIEDNFSSPGRHSSKFDGSNFASGVYFYKLEVNEFTEVKKMLMIK